MPRESYATQQAKIEKEINKLRKRAEALQSKRRKPVIASIVDKSMRTTISPPRTWPPPSAPTSPPRPGAAARPRLGGAPAASKRSVAPKYRHPQTGETLERPGQGPRWLVAAEAGGAKRDSFLIG